MKEKERIPRWYYRVLSFKNFLNEFWDYYSSLKKIYGNGNPGSFTFEEKFHFCDKFKKAYEYLWKTLKDILKYQKCSAFLPREIFIKSEQFHIIKNSNDWINFIDDMNIWSYNDFKDVCETLPQKIVTTYLPNIYKLDDYFNRICLSHHKDYKEMTAQKIHFDAIQASPTYNAKDYNIQEKSFKIVIDFFRNEPLIDKVLVHGSRARGQGRFASDIDLIINIDSPEEFERINKSVSTLDTPYRVDFANFQDKTRTDFLTRTMQECSIIYRKEDFE